MWRCDPIDDSTGAPWCQRAPPTGPPPGTRCRVPSRRYARAVDVVIGVDAGGSYTRAVCVGRDGRVLGHGGAGGGSPEHNSAARENVRAAIDRALVAAARRPSDVLALTAGIAGLNGAEDATWADEFTAVSGIRGVRRSVNDAEVAHAGAFGLGPGVMAVAATGSMILGITPAGRHLRNDAFKHYAGGARHLSFDVVQHILTASTTAAGRVPGDADLVRAALAHWNAADERGLYEAIAAEASADHDEVKRHHGAFAPVVTRHAATSPLAAAALARLVERTRVGIELVAAGFPDARARVVLEGGLACSAAFRTTLEAALAAFGSSCRVVEPMFPPSEGAALMALRSIGSAAEIEAARR